MISKLKDGKSYGREIAKETDITLSHVYKIMNNLEAAGFVLCSKEGRKRVTKLSNDKKSKKLARACMNIIKVFEDEN